MEVVVAVTMVEVAVAASTVINSGTTSLSSVTTTLLNGTLPVLVTLYVHVTRRPTMISGNGDTSVLTPFVVFTMAMEGFAVGPGVGPLVGEGVGGGEIGDLVNNGQYHFHGILNINGHFIKAIVANSIWCRKGISVT
jgi:hypothetical protein